MSTPHPDTEDGGSDRYERLEDLLRQTLTLAGEIAEDNGRALPGECIVLRKRANYDPSGANRQGVLRSLLKRGKALKLDESEHSPSQSPSPASSVQEPFSPGSVAVSLDAVVEKGKTSDDDVCALDNTPVTSGVARFAEPSSNRSSLLSTDEGQHGLATQSLLPQLLSNTNVPKRLQRPSLPRGNTSMIVHSGQESLVEASRETCVPRQNTENPRNERSGRRSTSANESPQGSPVRSGTPNFHRNSSLSLRRPQKVEEESRGVNTTSANQPKWQVRILPVTSSRESGRPTAYSPALMKLEAVFPLEASDEGSATSSLVCKGEPSYIIITRPPMESSTGSPHPRADGDEVLVAEEKSLQEFIDEWEYDAEEPGVEERRL